MEDRKVLEYREYRCGMKLARLRDEAVKSLGDFAVSLCTEGAGLAGPDVIRVLARLSNTVAALGTAFLAADHLVDTAPLEEFRGDLAELISSVEEWL